MPTSFDQIMWDLTKEMSVFHLAKAPVIEQYPTLTHYTSMAGFYGIIDSSSMWATALEYLNDATEGLYGIALLRRAFRALQTSLGPGEMEYRVFLRDLSAATEAQEARLLEGRGGGHQTITHTCIVCFTTEPDQLSQWRGYANGIGGVSIQFPGASVAAMAENAGWQLIQCNYSNALDLGTVTPPIQKLHDYYQITRHEYDASDLIEACAVSLINTLTDYLVQFKHPKFDEEAEWRLISTKPKSYNDLDYRIAGSRLVPYTSVEVHLPKNTEPEGVVGSLHVTCGPNPQPRETRKAVQGYLWKKGLAATAVPSEAPYR